MLLALTAIVAVSSTLGQAAAHLGGSRGWQPWSPAVGFSILLIFGGQVVWIPGRSFTVAALIGVATAAALLLGDVRAALRQALPDLRLAVPVGALACVPFIVAGGLGVLGPGVNDDMSAHLLAAFWLRTHTGGLPVGAIGGDLIRAGYPIGPHGLVAVTAALGGSEVAGFAALMLAVPILTALTGLTWLRRERGGSGVAVLIGLPYLATSYLTQGAFKETIVALALLALAAALDSIRREGTARWRSGIPVGLIAGCGAYVYAFPGLIWPAATGVLFVALNRRLSRWVRPLAGALAVTLLAVGPTIGRMIAFAGSSYAGSHRANSGNLFHALSPFEALGVWPTGDYRLTARPPWAVAVLAALAVGALIAGIAWWWRQRRLAVPAALLAGIAVWVELALTRNVYAAAKGLAVLAPIVALTIAVPAVRLWRASPGSAARTLLRAGSLALLAGAALSTMLTLRDASVGLGTHGRELGRLRTRVRGERVLFLGVDHFAQWELRGAHAYLAGLLYAPHRLGIHPQKPDGSPNDADNFGSSDLDKIDAVITPTGAYRSALPRNFHLAARTSTYALYRRIGPTPIREPIESPGEPGAILNCSTEQGRTLTSRPLRAATFPAPIEASASAWRGTPDAPGRSASIRLTVPPGPYDISLEYSSRLDLRLEGPGLRSHLPAQLPSLGPFWNAGRLVSPGGTVTIVATALARGGIAGALHARPPAPIGGTNGSVLGRLALTRAGVHRRLVPIKQACGRWIDWYQPASAG